MLSCLHLLASLRVRASAMCEVRVEPERFLAVGGVAWPGFQAFKLQAAWICIDVPIRVAMDRYRLRIWLEANQGWAIDGVATRWRRVKEELERQKLRMVANGMENGGSRGGWRTAWWQVDNGLANGVANGEWRGEWEMKTSTTEAEEESRRGRWWGEGVTVQQRYLGCLLRKFMPCSPSGIHGSQMTNVRQHKRMTYMVAPASASKAETDCEKSNPTWTKLARTTMPKTHLPSQSQLSTPRSKR